MNIARMGRLAGVACLALLPAAPQGADLDARTALPLSTFPRETIAVETRSARRHLFEAWRADTPETRTQGLMFVPALAPDRGMIFPNDPPRFVAFWMRNTYIPLDLLFIAPGGRITNIAENAEPLSESLIQSTEPVIAVLELACGSGRDWQVTAKVTCTVDPLATLTVLGLPPVTLQLGARLPSSTLTGPAVPTGMVLLPLRLTVSAGPPSIEMV